jgi:hypothetical protein
MTANNEQALFNFLNEIPPGATDPKRRAMLRECSEQIQRILAASIRTEKKEKDLRRKDRHSELTLKVEQKPSLELEPKQTPNKNPTKPIVIPSISRRRIFRNRKPLPSARCAKKKLLHQAKRPS